jgi:hypothetical protein
VTLPAVSKSGASISVLRLFRSFAAGAAGGRRLLYSRCLTPSSNWTRRPALARMAVVQGTAAVGLSRCGPGLPGDRFATARLLN